MIISTFFEVLDVIVGVLMFPIILPLALIKFTYKFSCTYVKGLTKSIYDTN